MFGPSVTAGIVNAADLAGYRTGPVHIRRSMHVPPPREAVRDCMPVLFDLLEAETEPAVRVVLGHFVFVYIHLYQARLVDVVDRYLRGLVPHTGRLARTVPSRVKLPA